MLLCILAGLVLLALEGCSKGCSNDASQKAVAIVNGDEIPVSELDYMVSMYAKQFPTFEDELAVRKMVVDSLVITQLLVQEAYKRKFDQLEEVARIALTNKEKFLLDALLETEIGKPPSVSPEEIQNHYNKLEYVYHAQHILVKTKESAQMLLDSVKAGAPFTRLAATYSIDPSAKKNQGDLGSFTYGQMLENFQNAVVKMSPGEVSQPVETSVGWHLIKLVDRSPNSGRGTLAQMRADIKSLLSARKRNQKLDEYQKRIRLKYPVKIEKATVDFLYHKREELYPPFALERLPRNDFDATQLDNDEKALPLGKWDGGQITIGEYLEKIANIPREVLPDFDNFDSLGVIVFRLKYTDILGLEARRLGLEESDSYQYKMKRFRELTMAEIMRDSLPMPAPPEEKDLQAYYDAHISDFTTPAQCHIVEMLVSDINQAKRILNSVKGLNQFKEMAAELTEREGARSASGDLGWIEQLHYPEVFPVAFKTPAGGFGGPVSTYHKWSIFYVVDKRAAEVRSFDSARKRIGEILVNNQRVDAFKTWSEKARKSADITIYDDVIRGSIDTDSYPDSTLASK